MPAPRQRIGREGGPKVGEDVKLYAIQKRSMRGSRNRDYPDFGDFVMTESMGKVMWHYTSTVHQCFKGVGVSGVVKEIYSAKIFFGEPFLGGTVDDQDGRLVELTGPIPPGLSLAKAEQWVKNKGQRQLYKVHKRLRKDGKVNIGDPLEICVCTSAEISTSIAPGASHLALESFFRAGLDHLPRALQPHRHDQERRRQDAEGEPALHVQPPAQAVRRTSVPG